MVSPGVAPPMFTPTLTANTPEEALRAVAVRRQRHIERFIDHRLTDAEREVARLIASELLTVKQIATRLVKSPKTVANQLNSIYNKLESEFGLQPDNGVKREFLRRILGPHFAN
jgi:DNA-binding CsgD family transcriptional regulator